MYAEFHTVTKMLDAASLEFRIGNLVLASRFLARYPDPTPPRCEGCWTCPCECEPDGDPDRFTLRPVEVVDWRESLV